MSVNDIRNTVTTEIFEVKGGDVPTNATFILGNEDHTLGNALRYVLMQREETEFCGYSVPHPYEPKMNLRLQTRDTPAIDVLVSGLKDLEAAADCIQDVFSDAVQNFVR